MTSYDDQCGKKIKLKGQKVLGANSFVCGSYRGKTSRVSFSSPVSLNRVKVCS